MTNKKIKSANIPLDRKTFFFKWVEFTKPFHGLRKQLQDLLALLLYNHYELSLIIKNDRILWKQVFDYDTKVLIMEEMGIQQSTMENLLHALRKAGVVENNKIKPVYVPNITKESEGFVININFIFDDKRPKETEATDTLSRVDEQPNG